MHIDLALRETIDEPCDGTAMQFFVDIKTNQLVRQIRQILLLGGHYCHLKNDNLAIPEASQDSLNHAVQVIINIFIIHTRWSTLRAYAGNMCFNREIPGE